MARTKFFTKLTTTLVACAALMIGCGTENSPVSSSNEEVVPQAPQGRSLLAFSPQALERAGKISANAEAGRTVSAMFTQAGGVLHVLDNNTALSTDDIEALFQVEPNSIPSLAADSELPMDVNAGVLITMTVYGTVLEDLIVEFDPDGLDFDPVAMLNLRVGQDLVNTSLNELVIYHIHGDGKVDEAAFSIRATDTNLFLSIEVPGFSRYSPGGGWKPVAPIKVRKWGVEAQSRYSNGGGW